MSGRAALVLVLVIGVGVTLLREFGGAGEQRRRAAAVAEVNRLRIATDSCRLALLRDEAAFRAYDRRLDSLRSAVRAFESDGTRRTVPADDFDDYIALFDDYNAAVPEWHERADSLRTSWDSCRSLAEEHNARLEEVLAADRDE